MPGVWRKVEARVIQPLTGCDRRRSHSNSSVTDTVTAVTIALLFDIIAAWTDFTIGPNGDPS
jgi:hypothetical protein